MALLEVKNLHTYFKTRKGIVKAVNDVSYSLDSGKTIGIVGESGSGKSVSAMSILQLLDGNGYIAEGEVIFEGKDLTKLSQQEMYSIRGNKISVIFQEPMTSLNPVFTVKRQLSEPFIIHQKMSKKEAEKKAVEMLYAVQIPNPETVLLQYPHQLSGGMRQRVMIAMALACKPKILIADEPTTALDVTIQAQILHLMNELQRENGTAIIFITHDLGVINEMADDVVVMYCGQVVEQASARTIFTRPMPCLRPSSFSFTMIWAGDRASPFTATGSPCSKVMVTYSASSGAFSNGTAMIWEASRGSSHGSSSSPPSKLQWSMLRSTL